MEWNDIKTLTDFQKNYFFLVDGDIVTGKYEDFPSAIKWCEFDVKVLARLIRDNNIRDNTFDL